MLVLHKRGRQNQQTHIPHFTIFVCRTKDDLLFHLTILIAISSIIIQIIRLKGLSTSCVIVYNKLSHPIIMFQS